MYSDDYKLDEIKEKINELSTQLQWLQDFFDHLFEYREIKVTQDKRWQYMEIVKYMSVVEDEMSESYEIIDSSGTKTLMVDSNNPNIVSVLNDYGARGWEVINVREVESNDEKRKIFGVRETYTLKR